MTPFRSGRGGLPPRALRSDRGALRLGSLLAWAGVVVSIAFTYLAIRNVRLSLVWDALVSSDQWYLLPSIAALVVAVFLRAVRWRYVFRADSRPPLGAVTDALLIGYLFNNVLPARAGEAARVVALHRRAGTSRLETVGTVTLERVFDVLSLLTLLFVTAPFLPEVTWLRRAGLLAVVLVGALVPFVVVLAIFGDRPVRFLLRPLARLPGVSRERTDQAGANLAVGFAAIRDVRLAVVAFVVTTASWLALALSAWALFSAFHLGLGLRAGVLVVVATNLAQVLPSSPGALGVFEAATQLALGAYGVDESQALSYAILLHAVNFFPSVVVGYVVLHRHTALLRRRGEAADALP
ncbi:MAG: flippase-like domain-containing protein [Actinobacteria bacterium]|nr:flippase-like domain-containing protein [Actinomycetota bacterium]